MSWFKSNVAQLRGDIDSGRTGDKVAGFDPAAAPLGTDEEAGGTPTDPALVGQMRRAERVNVSTNDAHGASPELAPDAKGAKNHYLAGVGLGVAAALVLGAVYFMLIS
jgi:hypothetical protein